MALSLIAYNYSGDVLELNKSVTGGTTYSGEQVDNYNDLLNPSFVISQTGTSAPTFNYCYVSEYNRYYWIEKTTWIGGIAYQIDCHVDVLKTYASKITPLYAVVGFSNLGNNLEMDTRVNYKDQATRTETASASPYPTFIKDYDSDEADTYTVEPLIAIRYYYLPEHDPLLPADRTNIRIALMTERAFIRFVNSYLNDNLLDENKRVDIGRQIIDVSQVYYLSLKRIKAAITATQTITFRTPANPSGISVLLTGTGEYAYIVEQKSQQSALGYAMVDGADIASANYWNLAGTYITKIPYITNMAVSPAKMGIRTLKTLRYVIAVDLYGMQYIVTPTDKLDGTGNWYFEQSKRIPIKTLTSFPVDRSVENFTTNSIAIALGGISEAVGNTITGGATAGAATLLSTSGKIDKLKDADAASYGHTGNISGAPEWTAAETKKLYNIKIIVEPDTDMSAFSFRWGMPDHDVHQLSSLTGFATCEMVYMSGFDTATKEEIDEIERMLKSGVIY